MLPLQMAINAVTLAELSAGVHLVRGDDAVARDERARRTDLLQRVESEFDPIPFDVAAAGFLTDRCGGAGRVVGLRGSASPI